MSVLRFTVIGIAQPKGSTRAFMPNQGKYPVVTADNPKNAGWQAAVAQNARIAMLEQGRTAIHGPVAMEIRFYLRRPKAIRKKENVPHVKKPDLDKLIRSCCDALTEIAWDDDSQVVSIVATKHYARDGMMEQALIMVAPAAGS